MPDAGQIDEKRGRYTRKIKIGWISGYVSSYGNFWKMKDQIKIPRKKNSVPLGRYAKARIYQSTAEVGCRRRPQGQIK